MSGDHPPITPTRAASRDHFDGDAWRIYDYVVRHFLGTVSYNCKYATTTVNLKIGSEKFTFSGKKLIDPGFTAVMTWQALGEGIHLLSCIYLLQQALFLDISKKNPRPQKLKAERNSREFSDKLKHFLEKLTILPTQLANI